MAGWTNTTDYIDPCLIQMDKKTISWFLPLVYKCVKQLCTLNIDAHLKTDTYSCTPIANTEEVLGEMWITLQSIDRSNVTIEVGNNLFQGGLGFSVAGHDDTLLCADHELCGLHSEQVDLMFICIPPMAN